MARTLHLRREYDDEQLAPLVDQHLDDDRYDIDLLISGEDVNILRPDGTLLAAFRHSILDADLVEAAYPALRRAVKKSGMTRAAGPEETSVLTGTGGYLDRTMKHPNCVPICRESEFTANQVQQWRTAQPFLRELDTIFKSECPAEWEHQMSFVRQTAGDFVIPQTSFTTITVNQNRRMTAHKDSGDLGFTVLTVLATGEYDGFYLCYPRYRVAFDIRSQDVLMSDSHSLHGNTPVDGEPGRYERLSIIAYYREQMIQCGSQAEEIQRLRSRRPG